MAGFGQNRSFTETTLNVRLQIRKQSLGQHAPYFPPERTLVKVATYRERKG
jgi:hypothetical protein